MHSDNYIEANSMQTPPSIWIVAFLFVYYLYYLFQIPYQSRSDWYGNKWKWTSI